MSTACFAIEVLYDTVTRFMPCCRIHVYVFGFSSSWGPGGSCCLFLCNLLEMEGGMALEMALPHAGFKVSVRMQCSFELGLSHSVPARL